ncbi:MAG: DUF4422 domain-containing protein [Lachnospiraceae bacterium]|nr:DUF4422 domain-containing protein [Lachnospiraceae bacterium]
MREKIYIFGAHSRAQTLAVYLRALNPEIEIVAYLYDNEERNPLQIEGVTVERIRSHLRLHKEYPIYLGIRGLYHERVIDKLRALGFKDIRPVTVEMDLQLRNQYLKQYFFSIKQRFIKMEDLQAGIETSDSKASATIYVAKSIFDRALQKEYRLSLYEKEIQVGAALTEQRLYQGILTDDVGDNISERNRQYCELTALYWIWKHAKEDVVGLAHYRRHFVLAEDWVERMQEHEVDVILPTPLYVAPSIEGNYKHRHDFADWEYMMEYLKETQENIYQEAQEFFAGNLYSPCNMFIMRREILDEFCAWLFPILEAVVIHGGQKKDAYWNRYPGFISERLLTFYFVRKSADYKVVYADKNFLV